MPPIPCTVPTTHGRRPVPPMRQVGNPNYFRPIRPCGYFFLPLLAFATALDTALSFVEGAAAVLFAISFFGFFCSRPPFAMCPSLY